MINKKASPEDLDEITQRVRQAATEGRVESAPVEGIDKYPEVLDRLLKSVVGHPEAFVTDMSSLVHFTYRDEEDLDLQEYVTKAQEEFGVDITPVLREDFEVLIPYIAKQMLD